MHLGGLQKSSLVDYPGKLSSVIFFSGCNFDCPYCHNPQLARGSAACPADLTTANICDFLEQRQGFLDGVVVSGGEPTLQNDLADLCKKIKEFGYPVKLDTNGSRPGVLKKLIEQNLVDYIAMDLKTDPVLYKSYIKSDCGPDPILASIRILMASGIDYEFRTTCVKPIVTRETIENMSHLIQGARLYALQRFRNRDVLHPEFFGGPENEYSDEELMQLKATAAPWVRECILR
jgi:pyruvate formate lyase activating enzyme